MHWEISDWCNYACPHCIEGRASRRPGPVPFVSGETLDASLRFMGRLKPGWLVRLCAGEPSAHPGLLELAARLSGLGHHALLTTNLSQPLERYRRFAETAGRDRCHLHASLHLGQADVEEFLDKCRRLRELLGPRLHILMLALPENALVIPDIIARFERCGLELKLQLPRSREKPPPEALERYRELVWVPLRSRFESSTNSLDDGCLGQPCLAGSRWLLLDIAGHLWRCHGDRMGHAIRWGCVQDADFRLDAGPRPCPHERCRCPGRPIT
jgi:hypothetical protein